LAPLRGFLVFLVNHRLKQRLIGGAILVALGVIFLPMLLDGTGWRERNPDLLEIPPEPEFVMPERPASARRPVSIPEPVRQAAVPAAPEVSPASPAPPPPARAAEPAAPAKPPRAEAAPEPKSEPKSKPESRAPSRTEPNRIQKAQEKGWSVQVGAFEKKSGAEKLAARLRLRGYPVFIRRTEVGSKSLYRVKVGPVDSRAEALSLKKRLERSERLSSLVQRER
jgi:DedD protein